MRFIDRALIKLSELNSRTALFDQASLKNIIKSAYGIEDAVLQGAAAASFSSFTLGGLDMPASETTGSGVDSALRIDALWRGSIRMAAQLPTARIEDATYNMLSLDGLDADVAAANGGVMPVGAALEVARRTALIARLGAMANQAGAATESVVDEFIQKAGVQDLATLIQQPDSAKLAQVQLKISDPIGGAAFTQMDFPVALAALIRDPADADFSLPQTIASARSLQQQMRGAGFEPKEPSEAAGLGKAVTALIVPKTWFDDADWPGADQAARITAAGSWMAREGIGLVAVD